MSFYFITYQRHKLHPDQTRFIILESFVSKTHPFKWLAARQDEGARLMKNQTGPLRYTDYTIVFWKEISQEEYELAGRLNLYE